MQSSMFSFCNPKNEKIDENFYRRNLGEGVVLHRRDNYLDINK